MFKSESLSFPLFPRPRWITCSDSVVEFAKDYFEPLMQEMIPSGIGKLSLSHQGIKQTKLFFRILWLFLLIPVFKAYINNVCMLSASLAKFNTLLFK